MRSLLSGLSSNKSKQRAKNATPARRSAIGILALEPRFMFDAAGMATVSETVNDPPLPDGTTHEIAAADAKAVVAADSQAAQSAPAQEAAPASEVSGPAYQEVRAVDPAQNDGKKEVVFIESNVADVQTLIDGVKPGIEVVVLDAHGDGLAQMADWAQRHSGYDAVHVISHGAEARVYLGSVTLDAATAAGRSADLATLGSALTESGDILLYGCSVASGEGEAFLSVIAARTGSDVAASNDLTGATRLGGDWSLEARTGSVAEEAPFSDSAVGAWSGSLAATTLAAGDIAILGLNADDTGTTQRWAFVALTDIGSGTVVHFTDAGYDGSVSASSNRFSGLGTNEGTMTWTAAADVTAGKLFVVTNNVGGNATVRDKDGSTVSGFSGSLGAGSSAFFSTGDQIFAYQGTVGTTVGATFIYGVNTGQNGVSITTGTWITTGSLIGQQYSYLPDGLTGGTSAVALTANNVAGVTSSGSNYGFDNMRYNGITSGTKEQFLSAIGNPVNWIGDNTNTYDFSTIGNFTFSSSADTTSTVTSSATLTEPTTFATTATTQGGATSLLDFTIADLGSGDTVATTVTALTVDVSGTTTDAERALMTFLLNGPDATNVMGTYDAGTDKITFSSLNISVADGANETYTISAYYNDNSSTNDLTDGHTLVLSTNASGFTTGTGSSTMAGSQSNVTNGSGAAIDVTATKLIYTTSPSTSVTSGVVFGTQPVVKAVDANGNVDTDFVGTVSLTEDGAGVLTNGATSVAAVAGVATFTGVKYTAASDADANFTLTAGSGALTSATAANINPDVVATKLVFTTQPSPTTVSSGNSTAFTTVPVVRAEDADNLVDTDYTTNVVLSVVKSDGTSAPGTVNSLTGTGDADGAATTVTLAATNGVATFTGLTVQYTNSTASDSLALKATSGGLTAAQSSTITSNNNAAPSAGGDVTVTDTGGAAVSILEDASPNTANIRLTPTTNNDAEDGAGAVTKVRILTVTGGALTQSDGTAITLGASGTLLPLTGGNLDLRFTPTADRGTNASFTYAMVDSGGGNSTASTATVPITAVNDAPTLTAGTLTFTAVNEDSANTTATTLGLSGITYGPGGGSDESGQTLTITVTGIPSFVTLWKSDGTTQVNANDTLTLSEFQGLKYKTVANANGTANLAFTVSDDGGTANGGVNSLTQNLSITVNAVNDAPTLTAGTLTFTAVDEDSANMTATSLGLGGVTYGPGGGSDESGQTLSIAITSIPSFITLWKADGTTQVTTSSTLTLAEFQGLKYKTVADGNGTANIAFTVSDDGGTSNGGVNNLTQNLSVTVNAVNDAPTAIAYTANAVSTYDNANKTAAAITGATDVDNAAWTFSIQSISKNSVAQTNDGSLFNLQDAGSVASTNLRATTPSTLPTGTYVVTVRATDAGGLFFDQDIQITVSNALIVTTGANATAQAADFAIGADYSADVADGGGLSLFEALHYVSASGTVMFNLGSGTTVDMDGRDMAVLAGVTFDTDPMAALTISGGTLTLANGVTFTNGTGDALTVSSVVAGTGGLTKSGAGSLTLSGTNTVSGAFTVGAGGLTVSGGSAINDASAVTVDSGATLTLNADETVGSLTGAGNVSIGSGFTLTAGGDNASTGYSGVMSGTGGFTKAGSGTMTLTGANTYTGATTVSAGTLTLNNSGGTALADTSAVTVTGTLSLSTNETVGALSGAGTVTLGTNTLTVSQSTNTSFSGDIDGTGGLTKAGTGTLTLSGTNSDQTWAAGVTGGVLSVADGSKIGTGAVTLNGGGLTVTGTGATLSNAVTMTGAGTISNANAVELTGAISGSGALTKDGAGTLTLSNAANSSATSTLEVKAGAVSVASDSRLVGGAVTLNGGGLTISDDTTIDNAITLGAGNGTISTAGGKSATVSGVISGSGALTKDGTGTLTVTGNNTFSGSLAVTAGTLIAANATALGTTAGATTVSSDAALGLKDGITVAEAVSAAGTGVSSSGAIYNVSGTNTLSGNVTLTAAATFGVNAGGLTVSGNIGGAFALTKSGAETLILSGANSSGFTTLTVSGGTLSVAADSALGSGAVTLAAGTTLQATGATTIDNALTLSGSATVQTDAAVEISGNISGDTFTLTKSGTGGLTLSGTNNTNASGVTGITVTAGSLSVGAAANLGQGTLTLNGGDLTLTGNGATIGAAVALSSAATITNAQAMTLSGNISGSGLLTKAGAGNLTLSGGSSSYSGGLAVSAGTLTGTTASLLGNIANSGAVEFDQATNGSYVGVISGTGSLTKSGAGNVTFTGANTYTGATTVSAGTLTLNNSGGAALADTSAVTVTGTLVLSTNETIGALSGAGTVTLGSNTLTVSQTTNTTFSGAVGGAGGLTKTGSGTLTLSGNNTYTGTTTVSAGGLTLDRSGGTLADTTAVTVAANATLTLNQSDTVGSIAGAGTVALGANTLTAGGDDTSTTFSGVISGTDGNLVKAGAGTLILSGTNTYTGTTAVQGGGTLSIAGDGNLGSGALTLNASTLSVTGATTIDNAITLTGAAVISNSAAVTLSGVLSGTGSLTMSGSAALTLSNTNTYSGATTVSSGTLNVTGALNATSGVSVSSGATLSGTGSVFANASTNTLTVAVGGYLAPGTIGTAGQLTVNGNLTLNGTMKLDLTGTTAGTGYDQVVVNGTVTLGAASAFDVAYTVVGGTNNTFIVIDNNLTDAVSGTLNGVAEDGTLTSNARNYKASYIGGSGNDVTLKDNSPPVFTSTAVTAVNEDSAYSYTVTTSDPDGNAVTVTATTLPSWLTFANGVLSGTPGQAQIGAHTVVLSASDGAGGTTTQTFTVTVAFVNDAPVITTSPGGSVNEDTGYSYTPSATDEEGEAVTFRATTLPSWLKFENGVLSGTPGQKDVGTHTVTLTATDASGAVSTQTFTITVNAVNDAPVITSTPPTGVDEHGAYSYKPTATDEEGEAVTFTATTLPSWLKFENGVLTGTPDQKDVGTHTVTLTATDASGAKITQTFTITVNAVNDPPVFTSTPPTAVNEDSGYSYRPSASDPEGQTLTFTATTLPSWLTFKDGVLSGTPGKGDVGSHTVVLTATDASGGVMTQTFTVVVGAINHAPTFSSGQPGNATAGTAFGFGLSASDPDGGRLSFGAASLPSWLTLTDNGDGTARLSGTPGAGDVGAVSVTVRVTDASGAVTTQVLSFNVGASTATTLNITQTATTTTTTTSTTSTTTLTGSTTSTTTGGTGTNAGTGSTTVAIISGGGTASGGLSSGPGGSEVGRDSPATVRVGNVDGNSSSATGIQQTQGLTSTATSGDASASADGSTLVRNAARGDSAASSAFYGASTILSLSSLSGGSSTGGSGGFGAGTSGGFGGASGSSFGASAGGLGGGLSNGGLSAGTGGSGLGSGTASTGGATAATGGTQSGGTGSTGTASSGPVQGRTGGDGPAEPGRNARQGQEPGVPRPAPNPTPTQGDQGRNGQGQGQGQGQGRNQGEAPTTGGEQPAAPAPAPNAAPGPQTGLEGMDGLFRGAWALGPQRDGIHGPAPLPGRGISEQLAYAHLAFDRQTARLEAAAAALRDAA